MLKIRVPYSGVLTGLAALPIFLPYWFVVFVGVAVEIIIGVVLYKKLSAESMFEYDSFVGHLLLQYTFTNEVGILNIVNLICARIAAYSFFGLGLVLGQVWLMITAIVLFLLTMVHILSSEQHPLA